MIYTSVTIFGLTAIIGMYLLTLVLRRKGIPKAATVIHGLFAVAALALLVIYSAGNASGPLASIIIFVIAAMLGFVLNYRDLTGKKIPKWLAVSHGLIALAGFMILLVFAFR